MMENIKDQDLSASPEGVHEKEDPKTKKHFTDDDLIDYYHNRDILYKSDTTELKKKLK